jgi:hypothetical protein
VTSRYSVFHKCAQDSVHGSPDQRAARRSLPAVLSGCHEPVPQLKRPVQRSFRLELGRGAETPAPGGAGSSASFFPRRSGWAGFTGRSEMGGDFVLGIETIRKPAREHIDEGPITSSDGADRDRVIKVLNEVLATELVCVLRNMRHDYRAEGIDRGGRSRRSSSSTPTRRGTTPTARRPGSCNWEANPTSTPPFSPSAATPSTPRASHWST